MATAPFPSVGGCLFLFWSNGFKSRTGTISILCYFWNVKNSILCHQFPLYVTFHLSIFIHYIITLNRHHHFTAQNYYIALSHAASTDLNFSALALADFAAGPNHFQTANSTQKADPVSAGARSDNDQVTNWQTPFTGTPAWILCTLIKSSPFADTDQCPVFYAFFKQGLLLSPLPSVIVLPPFFLWCSHLTLPLRCR